MFNTKNKNMNYNSVISFLLILIYAIHKTNSLCVLESDFGFSINCNFKKSGMFRVRNLGGLKAHFGLGFSLGDELGFPESLGNVEGSRKRSINIQGNGITSRAITDATQQFQVQPLTQKTPQYNGISRSYVAQPKQFKKPQKQQQQLMTEALYLPLGTPPFRKLPQDKVIAQTSNAVQNFVAPHASNKVPQFQALPLSTSKNFETINSLDSHIIDNSQYVDILKGHTVEEIAAIANVSVETVISAIKLREQQMMVEKKTQSTILNVVPTTIFQTTLRPSTSSSSSTTTTTTTTTKTFDTSSKATPTTTKLTTHFPIKTTLPNKSTKGGYAPKKYITTAKSYKVMNAPKEYYPAGYDKNFDDNFKSKIDLPATSFHCGDQKHFPGLYADDDLGCMVFHVCALTDDGLVMKSFLCPESTLFDQTILKCNWWFYTDCKSSKTLYDSNLPVSKSYQLMKSLAFFSANYKDNSNSTTSSLGIPIVDNIDKNENVYVITPVVEDV